MKTAPTRPASLKPTGLPLSRRQTLITLGGLAALASGPLAAQTTLDWPATLAAARGQTVFFNAWGGSERINAYLQWAGTELSQRHGLTLQHVKLTDTADAVRRIRTEKAAGRTEGGSVDALWINGENFLTMKREGLLFGPFAESLPGFQYVDVLGKPTTRIDFSEPVEGMEAPWGMAQFTWFADSRRVPQPPRNMAELLALAKAQPGRISYPRPPDFHGTTFLKQALLEFNTSAAQRAALSRPVTPEAFAQATAPLWAWLAELRPHLWRGGQQFPASAAAIRQMMADGELLLALTFNPNEAANEVAAKRLPATVVSWQPAAGSVGNTHFLAIPFNARARAGALVFIDFMLSPLAQARKADIDIWGDPTVLAVDRLPAAERARFGTRRLPGQLETTAPTWPEPHASWVDPIEREWLKRHS
jgi:putative thiamine transport system substrate-binding protein